MLRMLSRYGPFSRASADIIQEEPQYSLLLLLCATVCVSRLDDGRCECECECKGPFTLPPTFQGPKRSCGQAEPDRGPPCQVGTHSRWWDVEYKAPYTNHRATVLPASAFSFSVPPHTRSTLSSLLFFIFIYIFILAFQLPFFSSHRRKAFLNLNTILHE